MTAQQDEPIRKRPPEDSKALQKIKPLDHEPATQRPYDPGIRPHGDDLDEDPWLDTGEPEGNG